LFATIWLELDRGSGLEMLSSRLRSKLQRLADVISVTTETQKDHARGVNKPSSMSPPVAKTGPPYADRMAVLPFSHPIFDKHLKPIDITVQPPRNPSGKSAKVFQEVSHWHNAKKRLDPKAAHALSDRDKMRAMRRNQFFMKEMASYAASLTGVTGNILKPELIIVSEGGKAVKEAIGRTKENSGTVKQRKGQASKGASSAEKIITTNLAAKGGGVADKFMAAWKTVRANLDAERSLEARYRKTKAYLRDLATEKRAIVQAEVEYYIICTLLQMYRILPQPKPTDDASQHQTDGLTAIIFSAIRGLSTVKGLTKTIVGQVKSISKTLKLPEVEFPALDTDGKLS
ncbi:MAG: hypothetical protein Q9224_007595, partial [Gallowayella concinna]